jgi:branched-chain amino acid transport system ATP-binding protein
MLKIQDVHLAYGPISAVRRATIEVEAGEVVAIVGGN